MSLRSWSLGVQWPMGQSPRTPCSAQFAPRHLRRRHTGRFCPRTGQWCQKLLAFSSASPPELQGMDATIPTIPTIDQGRATPDALWGWTPVPRSRTAVASRPTAVAWLSRRPTAHSTLDRTSPVALHSVASRTGTPGRFSRAPTFSSRWQIVLQTECPSQAPSKARHAPRRPGTR